MKHNSVILDTFTKIMKLMNHTRQWDAELAWYCSSATHWICLYSTTLESTLFVLPDTSLQPKLKFFEPSGYSTAFKLCLHQLNNKYLWALPQYFGPVWTLKYKFQNQTMLHVHLFSFQIRRWLKHAQHVSKPISTILLITVGIFHGFNCFGHMIYGPQTSAY